jgi:hypothetical protein
LFEAGFCRPASKLVANSNICQTKSLVENTDLIAVTYKDTCRGKFDVSRPGNRSHQGSVTTQRQKSATGFPGWFWVPSAALALSNQRIAAPQHPVPDFEG